MRIAAISDIHGNLNAFEAVLEHVDGQHVDQIVITGDIVLGAPDAKACWALAYELGCPIVRGNTDRFLAHYGTPDADPLWTTEQFAPLHWTVQQFTDEERADVGALPLVYRMPEKPNLIFCHGSPRSDVDAIYAYIYDDQLREIMTGVSERYVVRGHNHTPQVKLWEDHVIITCGSVGLPDNAYTAAQYLILEEHRNEWRIKHQAVPYDVDCALQRFCDTGYLEAAGPMGRLFMRTLATGTGQIVPFFRYYNRWKAEGGISLSEAVDRFFNIC